MRRPGVLEMLEEGKPLKICAPMVTQFSNPILYNTRLEFEKTFLKFRKMELHFRHLVRKWGCDVAFTPMITADSFVKSEKAREADFSTDPDDRPLIVQFGSSSPSDIVDAAEYIARVSDGIDINCGCPQKWAIAEKIGGYLLTHPDIIQDMIVQLRNRIPDETFTKSIKIRIDPDIRKSVDLCQQLEAAGVSFITVHGRTLKQKNEPADWDAIKVIKDSVRIPVFANGDIKTSEDIVKVVADTGVDGVMSANGLLANPAMFSGHDVTPMECVQDWLDINERDKSCPFRVFHHHLIWMTEKQMSKADRIKFSDFTTKEKVVDFITNHFELQNPAERSPTPRESSSLDD
ncbi:tRNA-dihydrouridine(20a/20b) synthase [NAD(P)+]-like [Hypsibius exemplaris]|uniref:tRNA-dihydrouridine(20a/20b) synthase [NAD(P)+]-like n=1 Tax=Hypsibius exemplaris TaxID=2072580 RepID=A0A1W0XB91_HYPEX|nr:tRNA-dihydrouridine(20a/20b) synthase [NAD(P)+]-like [Hypsibius exemplaris]